MSDCVLLPASLSRIPSLVGVVRFESVVAFDGGTCTHIVKTVINLGLNSLEALAYKPLGAISLRTNRTLGIGVDV